MCGYFCIGFINYMFMGKSLTDYTNLFSLNNFKKNDDIILNYFLTNLSGSVSIASFATVIGILIGITSASLSLAFSLCTGVAKNY